MEQNQAIKPGPKPKKDNGQDDKRRRVLPETLTRTRIGQDSFESFEFTEIQFRFLTGDINGFPILLLKNALR